MASRQRQIILASSSPYRKAMFERLGLPFDTVSPSIDESARVEESPGQLASRLAREKAEAVAMLHPDALVVGSDQVAVCGDTVLGKPGDAGRAVEQLKACSGKTVTFLSALAVICAENGFRSECSVPTEARFRRLEEGEIRRYVALDRPIDCAGAFKSEEKGISLLESLTSDDPTAIIGLPLIALSAALRRAGFELP